MATRISKQELKIHRQLMADFIYAVTMSQLLDMKGLDPDRALELFRNNQYHLLKKYNANIFYYYIDFKGEILRKC